MTVPLARKAQLGVIAKRPIANAAWRLRRPPPTSITAPIGNASGNSITIFSKTVPRRGFRLLCGSLWPFPASTRRSSERRTRSVGMRTRSY